MPVALVTLRRAAALIAWIAMTGHAARALQTESCALDLIQNYTLGPFER